MKYTPLSIFVPNNKGKYQRRKYVPPLQGKAYLPQYHLTTTGVSQDLISNWDEAIDDMREIFKIQPNTTMVVAWDKVD